MGFEIILHYISIQNDVKRCTQDTGTMQSRAHVFRGRQCLCSISFQCWARTTDCVLSFEACISRIRSSQTMLLQSNKIYLLRTIFLKHHAKLALMSFTSIYLIQDGGSLDRFNVMELFSSAILKFQKRAIPHVYETTSIEPKCYGFLVAYQQ